MSYADAGLGGLATYGARILVVEDDPAMQKSMVDYLNRHAFRASGVVDRCGLMRIMAVREPDLILMDIQLGDDDGLDLLRHIRGHSAAPVILMTGYLRDEVDRVVGLELGADDYLLKPFDMREMVARIRANLRRRIMDRQAPAKVRAHFYAFGGWLFDQSNRTLVAPDGRTIPLTLGEFALLSTFVAEPCRPLSRQQLLQATRLHGDVVDRSIDVQILRLRRKLEEDPRRPNLIKTQRGIGYVFAAEVAIR